MTYPPAPFPKREGGLQARMPQRFIVRGQKVTREKIQRAKELRQNMTKAEKSLWQHLRANRLDGWHFRRQQIIDGYITDFYCHAVALVIEIDGDVHNNNVEMDELREHALGQHGFRMLRFHNEEVLNKLPTVLNKIRNVLETIRYANSHSPLLKGEGPGERSNGEYP